MIYQHGGDIYSNRGIRMDFSVNLNPLGMPDFVRQAVISGAADWERYPDPECREFLGAACAHYGVRPCQAVAGNGAADLIFSLVRAKKPGKACLFAPSFQEYEAALLAQGTEIVFFPLKAENGFHPPLDELLPFLEREKPELLFLCNPANPSGDLFSGRELWQILKVCERNGIFAVVDECFLDFVERELAVSALEAVKQGQTHVFVLKALTKSFAMAGLRLGYAFCADEALLEAIRRERQPWSVSAPALSAGLAAFGPEREAFLERTRELLFRERNRMVRGLLRAGFHVYPGTANFLLFQDVSGRPDGELYAHFLKNGILIRSCANFHGLSGTYYRVCVRTGEENEEFLRVLHRLRCA